MKHVRTRKRGKTWSYVFEAGKVDGKRKVVEKGGFPSQDDAYTAGVEAYTDWKHGNLGITSERITLKDFLYIYLASLKNTIRPSTMTYYQTMIQTMVLPELGSIVLQELTPATLDLWIHHLHEKGYAKGTLSCIKALLHAALSYAVYPAQLISTNPCDYIKVPKNAPDHIIKRTIISPEQYAGLLELWPAGHPMHLIVMILYHTGLRIGEVQGLCWEDVDFDAGTLSVQHQCRDHYFGPLKTKSSYRTIYLSADFLKELQEAKEQQESAEELLGDSFIVHELEEPNRLVWHSASLSTKNRIHPVCIDNFGRMYSRTAVLRHLRLVGLNSHSFRHTQATRLAEAGVPPTVAAARLGHANTDTTLNVYTHSTEELQKKAAEDLEQEDWEKFFDS